MSKPLTESLVQNNGSQKELQTPENSPPSEASWEKGPVNWSAAVGLIDEHTEDKVPDSKDSRLTKLRKAETSTIWGRPWDVPASVTLHHPPGDYRDQLPPALEDVVEQFSSIPQNGLWTFGMLEMWGKRAKVVKSAVHVPCWEAFRVNPLEWRGSVCGRTCHQCYWLGVDRTRWARNVYSAGLGREYKAPCVAIPESHWKGRIAAVCWFQCLLTEGLSAGFGQLVAPGGCILNFAACYTCHAREKLRRKYNLPAALGLPPGFDDCCVHFVCMYCASHQEMRELAIRGIDGPGMHVLDVTPDAFKHLPGWEQAVAARKEVRDELVMRPPGVFKPFGRRIVNEPGRIQRDTKRGVDYAKDKHARRHSRSQSGAAGLLDGASRANSSVTASDRSASSAPNPVSPDQVAPNPKV